MLKKIKIYKLKVKIDLYSNLKIVQSKIKIEEYARSSRASSVVSNNRTNVIGLTNNLNRIHPVQRFSSEGKKIYLFNYYK